MALYDYQGRVIKQPQHYLATDYYIAAGNEDNTTFLQMLVDKVNSAGGGTIFFPNGTYKFKSSILMKSDVSIVGENIECTVFKKTGAGAYPLFSYTTGDSDNPITGCSYSNFTADGYLTGNSNGVSGKFFFYQYVKNCVFRDLILRGSMATALGIDYLDNVTIDNVHCIDCGRTYTGTQTGTSGIGIGTGGWENENFIIRNCVCVGSGQFGIFIENQLNMGWGGNVQYSKGCIIANCITRNGLNHGIGIRGGENVTVIGCESYENAKSGYSIENYCKNVKIVGCSAAMNAEHGIRLAQNAASDHVAIMNNTCVNNTGNGIAVENGTDGLCVTGNYTDGNAVGLSIANTTLTDAVVRHNNTIDGTSISATFSGETSYVDVAEQTA